MKPTVIEKKLIKEVMIEVNPATRTLFKNVVKQVTGIDAHKANSLEFEESIQFFIHLYACCLSWSNQRADYIEQSMEKLSEFLHKYFTYTTELHDISFFHQALKKFNGKDIEVEETEEILQTTALLEKFPSVGFKTAALMMRFLCLDSNYFTLNTNHLIPPLDRVNYRMCQQLLGKSETQNRLGNEKPAFKLTETKKFAQLGRDILGVNCILIDNLWFIGHFYCDSKMQNNCRLRKGIAAIEFSLLTEVNLQETCPFYKYGCRKNSSF